MAGEILELYQQHYLTAIMAALEDVVGQVASLVQDVELFRRQVIDPAWQALPQPLRLQDRQQLRWDDFLLEARKHVFRAADGKLALKPDAAPRLQALALHMFTEVPAAVSGPGADSPTLVRPAPSATGNTAVAAASGTTTAAGTDDPNRTQPAAAAPAADSSSDETRVLPPSRTASGSAAAQAAPLVNGLTIGDYEVLGELGRGGMGVVYRARQLRLKRLVALKMILNAAHAGAEELRRFQGEAEAAARLHHPHIVQIFEIGEHAGRPFLALELVEGGSLAERLRQAPLAARPTAQLLQTLAHAIHHAHQHGIVHRDLKPANILLARSLHSSPSADTTARELPDGEALDPKITDFGLAKRLDEESGQTQSGAVMGTPSYMAPEQAAGRIHDIGPAADVYALGAILYETLTARPPFKGATAVNTVSQVLNDDPLPPSRLQPQVPRDLETICLKCLQKDPAKRYASAEALADDLGCFLAGTPIRARALGRLESVWRWCRRNPVPASLLLAVTLGGAFGLWYLSQLSQSLVRYSAQQGAAQQAEMLHHVWRSYSKNVAERAQPGTKVTHLYQNEKGAIPAPATFTIELGHEITTESKTGMQVKMYSDAPFKTRKDGGPPDDFAREALRKLQANPQEPVSSFEDVDGKPVLRYATAVMMKESCLDCHNTHKDSPRHDWKEGQVRGVLEIVRPLDKDVAQTRERLRGTFRLLAGIFAALLLLSSLVLLRANRRRNAAARWGG